MNNKNWTIVCWNIKGLNATEKHDVVRDKIEESACSIICLQETKTQVIDMPLLRKFTPDVLKILILFPQLGPQEGL